MSRHDNWMPLYVGDYLADTAHLDGAQSGAYLHLLMHYWRSGPLPDDDAQLAAIAKTQPKAWKAMRAVVRAFFTVNGDGRLHQKRIDAELKKSQSITAVRSSAGQNGGMSKWHADSDSAQKAAATRSQRLAEARKKGTHTPEEWAALLEICGGYRCVRCGTELTVAPCKDHIRPIYRGGSDAIDNLQPMCPRCNSQKGPEEIDYRPPGWRDKMASKTPSKTPDKCPADGQQNARQTPTPLPLPLPVNNNLDEESLSRARARETDPPSSDPEIASLLSGLGRELRNWELAPGKKPRLDRFDQAHLMRPRLGAKHLTPEQLAIARNPARRSVA